MLTINCITLKAYESMFADTAPAFQSCSCCHDNLCKGIYDSFARAYRNTTDSQLEFCRRRVLARVNKKLFHGEKKIWEEKEDDIKYFEILSW